VRGYQMKGEETWNAHVDSGICIRREVLQGVKCPETHKKWIFKKKKMGTWIIEK
jgi:hypothetical protein